MRIRVKGKTVEVFNHKYDKLALTVCEGYREAVLPSFGVYKVVVQENREGRLFEFDQSGVSIADSHGRNPKLLQSYFDGFGRVCIIDSSCI